MGSLLKLFSLTYAVPWTCCIAAAVILGTVATGSPRLAGLAGLLLLFGTLATSEMKYYLSSFRVGNEASTLRAMTRGRTIGFIPNAMDHVPSEARALSNAKAFQDVIDVGIAMETLDLQSYFGSPAVLASKLATLGGVWVRGGNTFVLRQAMQLSGFDEIIKELAGSDFFYGGYSAGICVLAPRLDGLRHVDDPTIVPYPGSRVMWDGLGLLDYLILPHYKSDHPESADIDIEVEYCTREGIPFRTLRDGEVIVIEDGIDGRSA